jgi:thiamine biosynthesis lipoprotein
MASVGDRPRQELARDGSRWVGRFHAMAGPCEVLMEVADYGEARSVLSAVTSEVYRIERKFSRYRADNIIHAINHSEGRPVEVDRETAGLLDYAARLHELSDGKFDITSGVLRKVWKFDCGGNLPSAEAVREVLRHVGWDRVEWDGGAIRLEQGMQIDLGGVGKEYAADRATRLAAKSAAGSCLVNLGGDLAVTRPRRDLTPWSVGITAPADMPSAAGTTIHLTAGAIATSGDANRYLLKDGIRYGHILDARTGWPAPEAPRSISVAAGTCLDAGMLSTFAILEGAGAEEFLQAQQVQYWVLR